MVLDARKPVFRAFANNTSLISTYIIKILESFICDLGLGEISIFKLVSVVRETGLNLILSETPKPGIVATRPILHYFLVGCSLAVFQYLQSGLSLRVCTVTKKKIFLNQNICCGYSKEPCK